jgi:hypothetical protein
MLGVAIRMQPRTLHNKRNAFSASAILHFSLDFLFCTLHIASNLCKMMNEWERTRKGAVWPNLKHYLGICLEELEKTTKSLRIAGVVADSLGYV